MNQRIAQVALVVRDYDEALVFYQEKMGFILVEDTPMGSDKRWVVVRPKGELGCSLILAKAANAEQEAAIGHQSGGRVFMFLHTDDFDRDYLLMQKNGVVFLENPREEVYGKVAVFQDLYGNKWDLIEITESRHLEMG